MSSNRTCKDCGLVKSELDYPKGKMVCKACIKIKTQETRDKNDKKANSSSPSKTDESSHPRIETDKKKQKLVKEFEELMLLDLSENKGKVIVFINKLTGMS